MFDLDAIQDAMQDTCTVEITHPTTGAGGWYVELATKANAEVQSKVTAILDRIKKRKAATPAQEDQDIVSLINAHILGWKGLVSGDKEVLYTPEAAQKILASPKAFWIKEQLLSAIGDPTKPFLS